MRCILLTSRSFSYHTIPQKFFADLKLETDIDLENIVYYKDDTHYFVMTAKKSCLLKKGVLKKVYLNFFIEFLLHPPEKNHFRPQISQTKCNRQTFGLGNLGSKFSLET